MQFTYDAHFVFKCLYIVLVENRDIFILINSRGAHFNTGREVLFSLPILKFAVFINILLSAVLGCNLSIGFFYSSLPLLN